MFRKLNSKIFNSLIMVLMNTRIHDSDCNFRAMRKEVAKSLNLYSGLYRYIPQIAKNKGFRVSEVPVSHRQRIYGKSKYGISRLYS